MKAMVFAAGLGTRLRPLTDTMPKALVPVGGRPLIGHVLDKLAAAGTDEAVVNVHHFPAQIEAWLETGGYLSTGASPHVSISDESGMLLETGGGLLHAEDLLCGDGPFLVHNVDILSNLDLRAFAASMTDGELARIVVSSRKTSRYLLFDEDMRLVGWTNVATGEVRSPVQGLDPRSCKTLAFAGIHCLSPGVFSAFRTMEMSGRFSIIDFYIKACSTFLIRGYVPEDFRMMDVGKIQTLGEADRFCEEIKQP